MFIPSNKTNYFEWKYEDNENDFDQTIVDAQLYQI